MAPYDDVAEIVGAQLRTTGGGGELTALADAMRIVTGSDPKGSNLFVTHDGLVYQYEVHCFDSAAVPGETTCRAPVRTATVSVLWGGTVDMPRFQAETTQRATWQISGLTTGEPWISGTSASWFDSRFAAGTSDARSVLVQTMKQVAYVWNPATRSVSAGSEAATISAVQQLEDRTTEMTGTLVFERADRTTLALDDRLYWIDPASGTTVIATSGDLQ